ncbi:MAG: NADP-dependent oxidoreductase [Kofleriaceae bacterium]
MVSLFGEHHHAFMSMRTLRFHTTGEPADVLVFEQAPLPTTHPGRIRVAVHACGLNPADWALCRGLFPGSLPRGVGLDVAGIVEQIGDGVTDVAVGDRVVGAADFVGSASAGASDFAILDHWAKLPERIGFVDGAALPMAIETAALHLGAMDVTAGRTLLVHGAGTMIGFAAVQIALLRGARVIATAGETYAEQLRSFGASVTTYGAGMVDRVKALGSVDIVLDTSPAVADPKIVNQLVQGGASTARQLSPVLADLVQIAGDAKNVVTISNMAAAAHGVRTSFDLLTPDAASPAARTKLLREYVDKVTIPVARTFALDQWRDALAASLGTQARGKLVLVVRS